MFSLPCLYALASRRTILLTPFSSHVERQHRHGFPDHSSPGQDAEGHKPTAKREIDLDWHFLRGHLRYHHVHHPITLHLHVYSRCRPLPGQPQGKQAYPGPLRTAHRTPHLSHLSRVSILSTSRIYLAYLSAIRFTSSPASNR